MEIKNFYIEKGSGFPLILLHGNGEDHSYFEHQLDYFSKRYRVIALDTRGHGSSPRGCGEFNIARFAEDLYYFMIAHSIKKAHILGFSDGANIAIKFAIKYPEMVDKLILNGGNLFPAGVKRSAQLPIEIGFKLACLFAKKSVVAKKNAEILGLMVNDPNIDPGELCGIKAKTLVIAGTRDLILKKHTELIAESIPGAKLNFVEGNHFVANKNSDDFNTVVETFLAQ